MNRASAVGMRADLPIADNLALWHHVDDNAAADWLLPFLGRTGDGNLYAGRVVSAVLWFLVVSAGYVLLLPGLVLHLFNIVSAAGAASQRTLATRQRLLAAS